jgi:PIN domain nuclease of toxin-antitoxin system
MISAKAEKIIDEGEYNIYISSASLWEIVIKISKGRLETSFDEIANRIGEAGFTVLQTELRYLRTLFTLPFIHNDPFDRLIIATALTEGMVILTADGDIHKYDVGWVW